MTLRDGSVQFWQGDTDLPPLKGHYKLDTGQVILTLGNRIMTLSIKGDFLHPKDDPSQPICKTR